MFETKSVGNEGLYALCVCVCVCTDVVLTDG